MSKELLIVGFDPGPTVTGVAVYPDDTVISPSPRFENIDSKDFEITLSILRSRLLPGQKLVVGLESMLGSYGKTIGMETIQTCYWTGRMIEICISRKIQVYLCPRVKVKTHLLNCASGKDSQVNEALTIRFGEKGNKKNPGPLFGISKHSWQALGVATYLFDNIKSLEAVQ